MVFNQIRCVIYYFGGVDGVREKYGCVSSYRCNGEEFMFVYGCFFVSLIVDGEVLKLNGQNIDCLLVDGVVYVEKQCYFDCYEDCIYDWFGVFGEFVQFVCFGL